MTILTENIKLDAHMEDILGVEIESVFDYTRLNQFNRGEAVGIYLHKLYYHTMDLIGLLLYYKHPVTLKYEGKQYKLYTKEDWIQTFQDPNDQLKMKTVRHPIFQEYLDRQREQRELLNAKRVYEKEQEALSNYTIIDEPEVDRIVRPLARLYDIDVDYENQLSKTMAYYQILYYLDNNVPYTNPAPVVAIDDEKMFNINMFKIDTDTTVQDLDVESFGDATYFDDFVNKNKETLDIDYI
jgi:hypothetical protein